MKDLARRWGVDFIEQDKTKEGRTGGERRAWGVSQKQRGLLRRWAEEKGEQKTRARTHTQHKMKPGLAPLFLSLKIEQSAGSRQA